MWSGIIRSMASTPATDRRSGSILAILYGLIRSMRPRQAPKNGLVLIALFFTVNKWWDLDQFEGMVRLVATSVAATLIFIIVSGVVYIVNDLFDAERDLAKGTYRQQIMVSKVGHTTYVDEGAAHT